MRAALAALVLTLAFAAEAAAAPQSLAPMPEDESFALAGNAALATDTVGRRVRIDRWPLISGVPPTTVFRHVAEGLEASATVSASDELAAVGGSYPPATRSTAPASSPPSSATASGSCAGWCASRAPSRGRSRSRAA